MKLALTVALAATLAGCASPKIDYGASLSKQDPKWSSAQCQKARADAAAYDERQKNNIGYGTGILLGPYGLGLAAATKAGEKKNRKLHERDVHLQCSSQPLPKDLDGADLAPAPTKYP